MTDYVVDGVRPVVVLVPGFCCLEFSLDNAHQKMVRQCYLSLTNYSDSRSEVVHQQEHILKPQSDTNYKTRKCNLIATDPLIRPRWNGEGEACKRREIQNASIGISHSIGCWVICAKTFSVTCMPLLVGDIKYGWQDVSKYKYSISPNKIGFVNRHNRKGHNSHSGLLTFELNTGNQDMPGKVSQTAFVQARDLACRCKASREARRIFC